MRPPLTEHEHRLIGEWLSERFGLRFGPEKRDILRSRLDPRRAELGFATFEDLYFHLKFHPRREQEWERLVPHLTNNESYFFRETGQLELLRAEVLERVRQNAEAGGRREIRVLSAGCAAGEEPYTLGMVVRESGVFPSPWTVRITGVDMDPAALERARTAEYTDNAFRRSDPEMRERYFTRQESGRWQLDREIRSLVRFQRGNLVDPDLPRELPLQDVVFCRNVLIYFGPESIERAVDSLYRMLRPGGFLFLGHAESLSRVPTRLVAERRPGAIFYRRPEHEDG